MSARPSTDRMRKSLKLATKSALASAGGAADIVRNRLVRIGEAALSFASSMSEEHESRFVGIDVALDLDFIAGEPIHTRTMADHLGYKLVRKVPDKAAGVLCLADLRRLSRDYSEFSDTMFEAFEDGDLKPDERVAMLAELSDLERTSASIRAKLVAGA